MFALGACWSRSRDAQGPYLDSLLGVERSNAPPRRAPTHLSRVRPPEPHAGVVDDDFQNLSRPWFLPADVILDAHVLGDTHVDDCYSMAKGLLAQVSPVVAKQRAVGASAPSIVVPSPLKGK